MCVYSLGLKHHWATNVRQRRLAHCHWQVSQHKCGERSEILAFVDFCWVDDKNNWQILRLTTYFSIILLVRGTLLFFEWLRWALQRQSSWRLLAVAVESCGLVNRQSNWAFHSLNPPMFMKVTIATSLDWGSKKFKSIGIWVVGFWRNPTDDLGINSPSLWLTEPRLHLRSRVVCDDYIMQTLHSIECLWCVICTLWGILGFYVQDWANRASSKATKLFLRK